MATTGDDCYFFYYSTCSKGSLCPYRHSAEALGNEVTCINWKQGFCYRPNCAFRHMDITKNRSEIQCYWETQPTGCQKPHCPFKHVKRGTIEGASIANSSMSLINKLPTITGPVTKAPPAVVTTPAVPSVTPTIQPPPQEMEDSISMPTVKPVVVTPMDSEDDESIGTMSTDGSPAKRVMVSPLRPLSRPPAKDQPNLRGPVRTLTKAKPIITQDKPLSLGIKSLAEIRREKNMERGHDDDADLEMAEQEEETEEAEEDIGLEEKMMEIDYLNEEGGRAYPSLTRRIISVSSTTKESEPTTKPSSRRALIQTNRKGETDVRSVLGIQEENRIKRLGSSLEQEDTERGNITKRIKILQTDPSLVPTTEDEPKKTIMRRVVVGRGGGGSTKEEADSSGLDSIKIKTVAEIKKEKLAQRLGKQAFDEKGVKDDITVATSSASRTTGLAGRLGKVVRTFGSDDDSKSKKDDDAEAANKRTLAGRLGTITRTVKPSDDGSAKNGATAKLGGGLSTRLGKAVGINTGIKDSPEDEITAKTSSGLARRLGKALGDDKSSVKERIGSKSAGSLVTRLGKVVRVERGSDMEEKSSSSDIRIKSLEEIKREKLLRRLGKLPRDGDEARSSDGERQASSQEEDEEDEDEDDDDDEDEDEDEDDEDDEDEEEQEDKRKTSEVRIKTLEEIRLEKQRRLGPHVTSKSAQDPKKENVSAALQKGVQSAQERRNRKRTPMAIYKPPAALRGSKENQTSGPGVRRSVLRVEEKERKSDDERPIKVRRLNLSKSVESANKGTESLLKLIKKKNEEAAEVSSSSVKVKSLAEIRAEKRLAGGDQEMDSSALSPEQRGMEGREEEKTEEERRREKRAKIWSRIEVDEKPQKPAVSVVGKGDEGKSQDEIRRERRARLWNVTPSGDAPSRPVIRRPGQVTSSSDPASEIKIKTLAEIRREKQLREQQKQQQRNGNQASSVSSIDYMQKVDERTSNALVSVGTKTDSPTKDLYDTDSCIDSLSEERKGRIERIPIKNLETGDKTFDSDDTEVTVSNVSSLESVPVRASAASTKIARKPLRQRLGKKVEETLEDTIQVAVQAASSSKMHPIPESVTLPEPSTSVSLREAYIASGETQEGSRQDEDSANSYHQEDSNISLISLHSEPDTTTIDSATTEDNMVSQAKLETKRLASITDDDDLHRFLEEHDDDADLDDHGRNNVAPVAHDDDDLLNELDDFLNS